MTEFVDAGYASARGEAGGHSCPESNSRQAKTPFSLPINKCGQILHERPLGNSYQRSPIPLHSLKSPIPSPILSLRGPDHDQSNQQRSLGRRTPGRTATIGTATRSSRRDSASAQERCALAGPGHAKERRPARHEVSAEKWRRQLAGCSESLP